MQILRIWFDLKPRFFATSRNSQLPLGLLDEILCLLQLIRHRVERPLAAAMLDVNPVVAHGFNYDAGLFHGARTAQATGKDIALST
jgi:hypothetical protein